MLRIYDPSVKQWDENDDDSELIAWIRALAVAVNKIKNEIVKRIWKQIWNLSVYKNNYSYRHPTNNYKIQFHVGAYSNELTEQILLAISKFKVTFTFAIQFCFAMRNSLLHWILKMNIFVEMKKKLEWINSENCEWKRWISFIIWEILLRLLTKTPTNSTMPWYFWELLYENFNKWLTFFNISRISGLCTTAQKRKPFGVRIFIWYIFTPNHRKNSKPFFLLEFEFNEITKHRPQSIRILASYKTTISSLDLHFFRLVLIW